MSYQPCLFNCTSKYELTLLCQKGTSYSGMFLLTSCLVVFSIRVTRWNSSKKFGTIRKKIRKNKTENPRKVSENLPMLTVAVGLRLTSLCIG